MDFKINDLVTRNSYNNDIVFKIVNINNDTAILKGIEYRLEADSPLSDLKHYVQEKEVGENPKIKTLRRTNF